MYKGVTVKFTLMQYIVFGGFYYLTEKVENKCINENCFVTSLLERGYGVRK